MNAIHRKYSELTFLVLSLWPILFSVSFSSDVWFWFRDVWQDVSDFVDMPRHALFSVVVYVVAVTMFLSALFVPYSKDDISDFLAIYKKTNLVGLFGWPLLAGLMAYILGIPIQFIGNWVGGYYSGSITIYLVGYLILILVGLILQRLLGKSLDDQERQKKFGLHLLLGLTLGIVFLAMKPEDKAHYRDHMRVIVQEKSSETLKKSIIAGLNAAKYDNIVFSLEDLVELGPYHTDGLKMVRCTPFALRKYIQTIGVDFPRIRKEEDLLYLKFYGESKLTPVPQECVVAISSESFTVRANAFAAGVGIACENKTLRGC